MRLVTLLNPQGMTKQCLLREMIQPLVSMSPRAFQSYANLIEAWSCKTLQLQYMSNTLSPEKQEILVYRCKGI